MFKVIMGDGGTFKVVFTHAIKQYILFCMSIWLENEVCRLKENKCCFIINLKRILCKAQNVKIKAVDDTVETLFLLCLSLGNICKQKCV